MIKLVWSKVSAVLKPRTTSVATLLSLSTNATCLGLAMPANLRKSSQIYGNQAHFLVKFVYSSTSFLSSELVALPAMLQR